jgi:hypothetical protein
MTQGDRGAEVVSFKRHHDYARATAMFELLVFLLVASGMLASCAWALYTIQQSVVEGASLSARDIRAGGAVLGGTLLAVLILVFSRRWV